MKESTRSLVIAIVVIVSMLIAIGLGVLMLWPNKPEPNSYLIENAVLKERIRQDSIRMADLMKLNQNLETKIIENENVIVHLNENLDKIQKQYSSKKKELDKLSSSELLDQFVDKTGGREDSLYSLPKMNLLNALIIFAERDEFTEVNLELRRIVGVQKDIIDLKDQQLDNTFNMIDLLSQNINDYKSIVQNQVEEEAKLLKKINREQFFNKVLIGTNALTLVFLLLK